MGCNNLQRIDEQPVGGVEYTTADGVNIMQITVPLKDTIIPQHSHEYDHTTLVTSGSVLVWVGDVNLGEYKAPKMIFIKANAKHAFKTLEDNTSLYCIHNVSRNGKVEVKEENSLEQVCLGQ